MLLHGLKWLIFQMMRMHDKSEPMPRCYISVEHGELKTVMTLFSVEAPAQNAI